MVGRELQFPSFWRALESARDNAGVVDEQVQRSVPPLHESLDRRLRGQVEKRHLDISAACGACDFLGGPGSRFEIADGQGDDGARGSEGARGLEAETG